MTPPLTRRCRVDTRLYSSRLKMDIWTFARFAAPNCDVHAQRTRLCVCGFVFGATSKNGINLACSRTDQCAHTPALVQVLVEHGAAADKVVSTNGYTPMMIALENDQGHIITYLRSEDCGVTDEIPPSMPNLRANHGDGDERWLVLWEAITNSRSGY